MGESVGARPTALVLDPNDNVAVALVDLAAGDDVLLGAERITLVGDVRFGHKIAVRSIPKGEHVRKYNEVIGVASSDVVVGQHVHVHNVDSARLPSPQASR